MDIFRKIFGLTRDDDHYRRNRRNDETPDIFNDPDQPVDPFARRGFDVFTDPLQMHQYFEQQMNELLKNFGFHQFGHSLHSFSDFSSNFPAVEEQTESDVQSPKDLREQFLKPGYEQPKSNYDKFDKDLDDKVKAGNLDSLILDNNEKSVTPLKPQPRGHFYGFSHGTQQSLKTVTKPDGSIETHRTVRDTIGNEETSVCHKLGNKEYCVIKKRDTKGNEETTEQFVNMTEDEKDIFFKPKNKHPEIPDRSPNAEFWDKLFK